MALVAPMGVTLELSDQDKKYPGIAVWVSGTTFIVTAAVSATGLTVVLKRHGEMLLEFDVGLEGPLGAMAGDSFSLEGVGPAIAANIYELIERGVFLNADLG